MSDFHLADGRWTSGGNPDESGTRISLHSIKGWRAIRWLGPGFYRWERVGSGFDWRWSDDQHVLGGHTWYFNSTQDWHDHSTQHIHQDVLLDWEATFAARRKAVAA